MKEPGYPGSLLLHVLIFPGSKQVFNDLTEIPGCFAPFTPGYNDSLKSTGRGDSRDFRPGIRAACF
jgi:hypothetical protein